jgi:predicted negative regulator of RcsB-dependent stress response
MFKNNKYELIFVVALAIIGIAWFGYKHFHDEHVKAAQFQQTSAQLEACEAQAGTYLQQYNSSPLLPQHSEYLTEYNSAIQQCKQQY